MKLTTTLNKIRACSPCASGWRTLVKHLGEDFDPNAEINLLTVLESNGVADMLWTLRAAIGQDSKRVASQLAIEFAATTLPIFEKRSPNDERPRKAIQAARDYLDGKISLEELRSCRSHAADAADAAAYAAAAYAAADAAYATYVAAREKALQKQAEIIRMILEA